MASQLHSAADLGKQRDYWWNADFLELMARRLQLDQVKTVLDVGCGIGHWGQILSTILPEDAFIVGIEREEEWVQRAQERVKDNPRFEYWQGTVQSMPFPDQSFDMVTCQTLLIHVPDVDEALKEMYRVLKPGGLLLAVEPNNFASQTIFDTLSINYPISDIMQSLEFLLLCEKGKQNLGYGFDSMGDVIPEYFRRLGVQDIRVYLSDKTITMIPPYKTEDQQIWIEELHEWFQQDIILWDKDETEKYYLAGGGKQNKFEEDWQKYKNQQKKVLEAINRNEYTTAGGSVFYLISGRK